MKIYPFSRNRRLTTGSQFRNVLAHKCMRQNDLFKLYVAGNDVGHPRLGLSVSKKCGNAVKRNRLKRLAREAFRLSVTDIPSDYDYLLIYTPNMSKNNRELQSAEKRIGLDDIKNQFVILAIKAVQLSKATTERDSGD